MQTSGNRHDMRRIFPCSGNTREGSNGAFTLIELMIVVTILAIILAIVIPSFLHAKMAANESSAIASLKTLCTSQAQYRVRAGSYGPLADLVAAGVIDDSWADGRRSGYLFAINIAPNGSTWSATGDPDAPDVTGKRHFYCDESGVVRFREGAPAVDTDQPVQ